MVQCMIINLVLIDFLVGVRALIISHCTKYIGMGMVLEFPQILGPPAIITNFSTKNKNKTSKKVEKLIYAGLLQPSQAISKLEMIINFVGVL